MTLDSIYRRDEALQPERYTLSPSLYPKIQILISFNPVMLNPVKSSKPLAPIQLISFDVNKKIAVNPEAVKIIQSFVSNQIAIVTVVGKYRTGKSFILNRVLLGTTKGFEVGPTINACTKGLWIWPEIVEMDTEEGKVPALIMDTEGLGSLEQGENTDTKIFLLATLLSSYLIYNSMGSIDEKAIQNLGLIVNLTNILQKANKSDHDDIVGCFPSFMWLVRDFFLKLEDESGEPITSKQYLENALRAQKGRTETIENKNKIRTQLRQYFRERECCTLVRPTNQDNDLRYLNSLPEDRLRPEFVQQIRQLKGKLARAVRVKTFQGKACTPQAFIEMCEGFVSAINDGAVPSVSSNWDNVCNSQSQKIISRIERVHEQRITSLVLSNTPLSEIESAHKEIVTEGYTLIDSTFLGALQKQQKKRKLKKKLKQVYLNIRQQQTSKQFDGLKQLIQQAFIEILREIRVNSFQSFQQVLQKFQKMSPNPTTDTPEMMGEFYKRLKNISVEYIRCLQEKSKMQNIILKEKEEWVQKEFNQKRVRLEEEVEQYYQRIRKDEMEKYKLRCSLDDKKERVNNLEEELFEHKQLILNGAEEIEGLKLRQEKEMGELKGWYEGRIKELVIEGNCKDIEYQQLKEESQLKLGNLKSVEVENNKVRALEETIQELKSEIQVLKQQKHQLQSSIKYQYRDQIPLQKQLNLRIRILQKQKHCLLKQLQNQKNINQGLMKTFQSNPSFIFMNEISQIEKQNQELKNQIQSLKQYEKVLISCDLLKCRVCQNHYCFREFKNHLLVCNQVIEFDVSYEIDGETLEFVYVVEVTRGNYSWRIRKSRGHVRSYLKYLGREEMGEFGEESQEEGSERRRVILGDILQELAKGDEMRSTRTIQFLGLDIHSKKQEKDSLSTITQNSFREVPNRHWEEEAQENTSGYNISKKQFMKTSKVGGHGRVLSFAV